jgi:signal transduction histidine kinase
VDILTSTAWDVRQGDWRARAPESLLADRRVERLGRVLNDMLDTVSASQRRQRELARRVLEAEERERERIAHELYAGTAQTLAGVLVRLRILARQAEGPSPCGPMDEITAEVRQALEEIRAVARRLRPPELDELGVRAALEAHARRLTEGRDLRVDFQGTIPESCLSEDARLALFRIAQEALTNAVRHAGARIVRARFVRAADALVAEVEDDGRGFDLPDTLQQGAGFGLMGMEERASYAGGSLAVVSRPGTGTRLRLVLPWVTPPGDGEAETAPEPGLGSLMPAGVPT